MARRRCWSGASRSEAPRAPGAGEGGPRVWTGTLTGDWQKEAGALRETAGSGVHMAFDMVGQARDPSSTLAALHSLHRGGRLVLMGSMTTDLPIPETAPMLNGGEILGPLQYPPAA